MGAGHVFRSPNARTSFLDAVPDRYFTEGPEARDVVMALAGPLLRHIGARWYPYWDTHDVARRSVGLFFGWVPPSSTPHR